MTDPTTTPRTISARLIAKLESGLAFLSLLCFRRPWIALGILALLTVGAAQAARQRLSLNADLAELLPSSFESVKDLETLKQRYGGIGYVGVVASHAEPDVLRRFVDDVAPRVDALASVRSVDYRKPLLPGSRRLENRPQSIAHTLRLRGRQTKPHDARLR